MSSAPWLESDVSLKALNTFGLPAHARRLARIREDADVRRVLDSPEVGRAAKLVLGGGSNLVLTRDIDEVVLKVEVGGLRLVETRPDAFIVEDGAGLGWHDVVTETLERGWPGLENLALIPGTVGAAPIQNIGAYGVEIKDVLHKVTIMHASSGIVYEMDSEACRFAYRDSIFKQADGCELIVLEVTFALPAEWQPNLRYGELAQAIAEQHLEAPTPQQVADTVMAIRRRKLPDPAVIGNAGSFFKNPVVSHEQCAALLERFPALVHHAQPDGTEKLAAGWLIDQCGWKGRNLGPVGVYPKQALVLVNNGGARGADITRLAEAIQDDVEARYGVRLSPEPVFV